MDRGYQPHIQLVPVPLWTANMRKLLPQGEWKKLRQALLDRQGLQCAVCGKIETESRKLNAHEEWHYIDTENPPIAAIRTISLLCWHCHHVEHWGVTKSLVAQGVLTDRAIQDTIEHFCRLNNATRDDFSIHEKDATEIWERRSQLTWRVDYGPFLNWVIAAFERDPLNDLDWPDDLNASVQRKPSMKDIVVSLPSYEVNP